jgi:hypothetical protein
MNKIDAFSQTCKRCSTTAPAAWKSILDMSCLSRLTFNLIRPQKTTNTRHDQSPTLATWPQKIKTSSEPKFGIPGISMEYLQNTLYARISWIFLHKYPMIYLVYSY